MMMKNEKFETPDIALGSYLFCCGVSLLSVNHKNPRRCIFIFDSPRPELISKWQEGKATVSALAFYNAYQALKAKVFQNE